LLRIKLDINEKIRTYFLPELMESSWNPLAFLMLNELGLKVLLNPAIWNAKIDVEYAKTKTSSDFIIVVVMLFLIYLIFRKEFVCLNIFEDLLECLNQ
jgi:hypothetical protein